MKSEQRKVQMNSNTLSTEVLFKRLETLANHSLSLWGMVPENATARLINVSENVTYLVEARGWKSVLRLHRENYHTKTAINCELSWSAALNRGNIIATPDFYLGRDGEAVQSAVTEGLPAPRHMAMFHFVEGSQPDENKNLEVHFEELGEIAARMHTHAISWIRPEPFERPRWDLETIFGTDATWGNWRDAPNVTVDIRKILQRAEDSVIKRLTMFGQSTEQYGLIHADMRLANLIVGDTGTHIIDFDDCGMGWFLYDFAAGISFIEDHPGTSMLKSAWVKGYRKIRALSDSEFDEIDTFIMLRRLALLAWVGSHAEAPEARALAMDFARISAQLAKEYVRKFG